MNKQWQAYNISRK